MMIVLYKEGKTATTEYSTEVYMGKRDGISFFVQETENRKERYHWFHVDYLSCFSACLSWFCCLHIYPRLYIISICFVSTSQDLLILSL